MDLSSGKLVSFGKYSLPRKSCQVQNRPMNTGFLRILPPVPSGNSAVTSIMVYTLGLSVANGSQQTNAPTKTKEKGVIQMGTGSTV